MMSILTAIILCPMPAAGALASLRVVALRNVYNVPVTVQYDCLLFEPHHDHQFKLRGVMSMLCLW